MPIKIGRTGTAFQGRAGFVFQVASEPIRTRSKAGTVTDIWLAGINAKSEKALAVEIERRYTPRKRPAR